MLIDIKLLMKIYGRFFSEFMEFYGCMIMCNYNLTKL